MSSPQRTTAQRGASPDAAQAARGRAPALSVAAAVPAPASSGAAARPGAARPDLHESIAQISAIKDLDSLLERVLHEARRFANADAGTIYMAAGNYLYFSYVQNDTLFRQERAIDKYVYSLTRLPINKKSLAGYVAVTGEPLMIDDVYDIKTDVSYTFNASYDRKTHYRTRSIMVVPLRAPEQDVVGVLQLINAKDPGGGVVPFSMRDQQTVSRFAEAAAVAIEKARDAREMVLRMVDIAEMRDPYETTEHARRVGAYSTEMYQVWAARRGIVAAEIDRNKSALRTAAILHDVGKIAISDTILRKPAALTYEEKVQMRYHTVFGARLFRHSSNPWDRACEEVTLGHHERWDGTGYPGHIEDIHAEKVYLGPGKRGEEIPLFARIVGLADVYDALVSRRAYKTAWKEEHALKHIHMQAGRHFDPELVDIFVQNHEIMAAIRARFPDPRE